LAGSDTYRETPTLFQAFALRIIKKISKY